MNRPGDWNCRSCNHLNFQRRDSCQRCGEARPGDHHLGSFGGGGGGGIRGGGSSLFGSGFSSGPDVRPGDWYCTLGNCGAHNFASRSSCFMCGAYKDDSAGGGVMGGGGPFDGFDGMSGRGSRGFGFGSMSTGGVGGSSRSAAWRSGDWICTMPGCNEHNFASRMECFRCGAPREASGNSSIF